MKEAIDYMVRYQWKETRNIVNKALSKVIRPLALKDLFYVNVNGGEHEIFGNKKPSPPPSPVKEDTPKTTEEDVSENPGTTNTEGEGEPTENSIKLDA